ncbi:MAG: HAMP domain-containing sensor histidine kinase [Trueperaceae bacterium]|nr:HAMP domain-containing sensor histidine kinase [Trueperaceae bacterium]
MRRQAVVGWVVALVDVDHLLADVVLVVGQDEISVTLRDDSGRVLATSGQLAPGEPGLARDLTLDRDGDSLLLEVRVDSSLPGQAARVPQLVLLLGTLLALAGAGLVWLLVTQRERALAQVAEATTALADSNAELEETNERLREFAGVVAHDLRGPLTAVHGMLSALELRIGDDLEPLDAELLARATRNSIQMDELIVDVLRYAESGVTPTDLEVLDLATTLTEVLERLEPLRQPDDVIDISVTGAVMADATGLRRVLGNLISNTLKYRHDGHPARVEVRTRREQDRVIIEVADDGPGIPHELRTELLAPFRRGDTSKDGSGLGLAICTRIVTNHGGTLEVDDADLGGALVRFDLPSA